MSSKKIVYMNEFNVRMGKATYLPLVSGILRAYAETDEEIRANYTFKPFLFCIDRFENLIAQYDEAPTMATFSISMWNERAVAADGARNQIAMARLPGRVRRRAMPARQQVVSRAA